MVTEFTKEFNIDFPIIGAPMFLVSTKKLVKAVSTAGGLGTFPALNYRPVSEFSKVLKEIKSELKKPFGVNLIVQKSNKHREAQLDLILENEVPLLITSLGNPKDVIKKTKGTKTKVYCDVIGLEHAKKVADYGADGLIAVAAGAGGHAGDRSPFALIPDLKGKFNLPIVAAGSIVDGKGLLAALALGASAVYMGTRIIASTECEVDIAYKNAIINAGFDDIISTDRVDGFPGNFILNEELRNFGVEDPLWEKIVKLNKRGKRTLSLIRAGRALFHSNKKNNISYKTVFSAGHGVSGIDSILSCKEIVENTINEYSKIKSNLP